MIIIVACTREAVDFSLMLAIYIIFAIRILMLAHCEHTAGPQRQDKNFADLKWSAIVKMLNRLRLSNYRLACTSRTLLDFLLNAIHTIVFVRRWYYVNVCGCECPANVALLLQA